MTHASSAWDKLIRVHVANAGFPVLGDIVYGKPVVNRILYKTLEIKRQLLHASEYKLFLVKRKIWKS